MQNDVQQAFDGATTLDKMGVDMGALRDEYRLSRAFVEQYTRDFQSLDNLVDGVALSHQADMPFVGDTTLAGMVRSIPRQSLQQLPVFSCVVNGTKVSIPAYICTYLLKKTAFNEDTFGKGLLSTMQIGAEQALTHGYAPFMSASGSMYNNFGTTMKLLHFSDTSPEPGITDANESGYHYVVANLTPSAVDRIIKQAKANPATKWNVAALEALRANSPRAKDYTIYESQPKQNSAGAQSGPTYEFVTRYPTGAPEDTIVTFSPELSEAPLRVMDSKSKFGYPRVNYLVIDPAALTPFGLSRVRLASPNQNLMNIYYGQIAAMLLLNSKPPILKRGRFTKPVQLKRGAVWETLDPQADAKMQNMDNGSLQFFPEMASYFAGQIQNVMGGQTQSNPATSKFSKTAPGVKQAQEFLDVNTNQITKILENFLRQYALVALDTLLSEQTGAEKIIVDDETKNKINQLRPGTIGEDNKFGMDWDEFYRGQLSDPNDPASQRVGGIEEWSVEIEVSVSKDEMEQKKRADLQDMLVVLAQNAEELGPEAQQKVQEITDLLMQDITPEVKPIGVGPVQPPAAAKAGPGQTQAGDQVHETADLVKLFTSSGDSNLRNAILAAMQLPPESPAALAKTMAAPPAAPSKPPVKA
jgi:hypothetical protein